MKSKPTSNLLNCSWLQHCNYICIFKKCTDLNLGFCSWIVFVHGLPSSPHTFSYFCCDHKAELTACVCPHRVPLRALQQGSWSEEKPSLGWAIALFSWSSQPTCYSNMSTCWSGGREQHYMTGIHSEILTKMISYTSCIKRFKLSQSDDSKICCYCSHILFQSLPVSLPPIKRWKTHTVLRIQYCKPPS